MRSFRAPTILLGCLFLGLPVGGLRDPLLWTATAALIWLVAFASPAPRSVPLKYWGLWLGWALLSVLASDQPLRCLYDFSRWATLVVFFHIAADSWEGRDSRRWLAGLAACAFILGAATLLLPGAGHPMTGLLPPYYNYTVFVEAAFFAAALGVLGHRDAPAAKVRWTLWGLMLFVLFLIVKARSRSGLVAIAAAVAIWMIRRGRTKWLALGLSAAAAAFLLAPPSWTAFILKSDYSAWFTRPQIWAAALKVARDHPFLGEGIGNFEQGFLRHNFPKAWATNYGLSADRAHSEPLEMAASTGWIGLALFLLALFKSLRLVRAEAGGPAQEAALCAGAAMATTCLFDNMLHMPALAMLFFTALIGARAPGGPRPAAPLGPRAWQGLCLCGMLLSFSAFLPRHLVDRAWRDFYQEPSPSRRVEIMSRAIRIFPADYYLRETLARSGLECRPPELRLALDEIQKASRLNPTNALYPMMQAELALSRGRRPEARSHIDRAIELEPNFLGARLVRAELLAEAGEKQAARLEIAETVRRRALLRDLPLLSAYDRAITYLDERRFAAAALEKSD